MEETPTSSSSSAKRTRVSMEPMDEVVQGSGKRPRLQSPKPLCIPLREWTPQQVMEALLQEDVPDDVTQIFQDRKVSGRRLLEMSNQDLKEIGVKDFGTQQIILDIVKSWSANHYNSEEKIFNDPIHGHIELHPLMVKIIDTPQFQRLRHLKQLGGGYYVFMGASHNRFEHSIGVGYLAGELVETLHRKQPELHISYQDILCVKIAGLCHDLGHGPFSHLFDGQFIPKVRPESTWKHEQASVMMFEHLLKENDIHKEFEKYGLTNTDILFIKELIGGPPTSEMCSQPKDWLYRGRPEEKSFLYEVVANKKNGIDVDKWDYFARDCHCLGIPNNFDLGRYMQFARVIHVNSRRQICTRDKEVENLYEMFHTRASLHRRAYQHKTSRIIEYMITDALCKANEHFLIPGMNGTRIRMSEAIEDPVAYTRLTDCVLQQIMMSTDPNLSESRDILGKVERRQLYKFIGQTQCGDDSNMNSEAISTELWESLGADNSQLQKDDLVVQVVTYDYGMKSEDPIKHMRFYGKEEPTKAMKVTRDQVSQMLPQTFREEKIRLYCKRSDPEVTAAVKSCFMAWCEGHRTGDDGEGGSRDSSLLAYHATPLRDTSTETLRPSPVNAKKNLQF